MKNNHTPDTVLLQHAIDYYHKIIPVQKSILKILIKIASNGVTYISNRDLFELVGTQMPSTWLILGKLHKREGMITPMKKGISCRINYEKLEPVLKLYEAKKASC